MSLTQTERSRNRRRVERGAKWLDEVDPTWYNQIDLESLDMDQPCGCVLGQLVRDVGPGRTFFDAVLSDWYENEDKYDAEQVEAVAEVKREFLGPRGNLVMSHREAIHRGFQVDYDDVEQFRGGPGYDVAVDDHVHLLFNHMTGAWRRQINERRG